MRGPTLTNQPPSPAIRRGAGAGLFWLLLVGLLLGCPQWSPPPGGGQPGDPAPATLVGIGVTPNDPKVTLGEDLQFNAIGYYTDQSTRDITDSVEWISSDAGVIELFSSIDNEGRGETVGAGRARVRARFFELESNDVKVTVTDATVDELAVTPTNVTLHADEEVQLQAEAIFSDGSRGNLSGSVRWIVGEAGVVNVGSTGLVSAVAEGVTSIRAVHDTAQGSLEAEPVSVTVVGGEVTIDKADVRAIGLSTSSQGDVLTYHVELKNSGGRPASGFWVDVWLNRTAAPPQPPTSGDGYTFVDLLDAGQRVTVDIELAGVAPGTYQSWVLVDSFGSVPEGNLGENNNFLGPEGVAVSGDAGPVGAELSLTYLQAFPQETQGQVLYIVDVTNTGDEAASDFRVGVYSNPGTAPAPGDTPDELVAIESVGPGETAYLNIVVRQMPDTWWLSWVAVDIDDSVEELDETNNLGSHQVVR